MRWVGYWMRGLAVAGLVAATTTTVWVKVQRAEEAQGIAAATGRANDLQEETAKLQAAVDLARRPSRIRQQAITELGLVDPGAAATAVLYVEAARD